MAAKPVKVVTEINMQLSKVSRQRLTDQVAEILYEKITSGELKPGDKLPGEIELSEQLGVARPTVREALSRLIGLGLVVRGDYTCVIAEDSNISVRSKLIPLILEEWKTRELYEARVLIESDLVSLAVLKATPENIEELRRINEKLIDEGITEQQYWDYDMEFHTHIAKISGNRVMQQIYKMINDLYKRYESRVKELYAIQAQTYTNHNRIITSIEKHSVEEARQAVNMALTGSEYAIYELKKKK
jgi:GntR family transcriptional repressor for pyruvate dehydrogenase complex